MTLRKGLVQPQQLTLEKRLATNVINRQNGKTKLVLAKLQVLVRVLILKKTVKETTKPNVVGVDDLAIQEINVPQKRRHATYVAPLVTMQQCLGVADPKRSQEANQEAVQEGVRVSRLHNPVKMELASDLEESRWTRTGNRVASRALDEAQATSLMEDVLINPTSQKTRNGSQMVNCTGTPF